MTSAKIRTNGRFLIAMDEYFGNENWTEWPDTYINRAAQAWYLRGQAGLDTITPPVKSADVVVILKEGLIAKATLPGDKAGGPLTICDLRELNKSREKLPFKPLSPMSSFSLIHLQPIEVITGDGHRTWVYLEK